MQKGEDYVIFMRYLLYHSIYNIAKHVFWPSILPTFRLAPQQSNTLLKIYMDFKKRKWDFLLHFLKEKVKIERLAESARRKRSTGCELSRTNDRELLPKVSQMSFFSAQCHKCSLREEAAQIRTLTCLCAALIRHSREEFLRCVIITLNENLENSTQLK